MIQRRAGLILLAAGAVLLLAAVAIWRSAGDDDAVSTAPRTAIVRLDTSVEPPTHLFGDRVVAAVEVVVDSAIVDPATVRVRPRFGPYELAGEPTLARRDGAGLSELVFRFPLHCLQIPCVSEQERRVVVLPEASISYRLRSGERGETRRPWTPVASASRLGPVDIDNPRWRLDLRRPPAVSYRIEPGPLAAGLLAASGALVLAAGVLAWLAVTRRRERPAPKPAPVSVRSPLERALDALAAVAANSSVGERRQALELVAGEVEAAGHRELADEAWRLAWSRTPPSGEAVAELSRSLRRTVGREG